MIFYELIQVILIILFRNVLEDLFHICILIMIPQLNLKL